ncbi:glycosyltransferase family 4 protein [Lysinibacillus sp. RS5]|uniref:glycosyltransferase family 4 protein n=1 Tax=unclassified Lysinibacillus TaxID=2636778 RepID=UPI0035BEA350
MKKMKVLFVASVYRHLTAFHIPYIKYFQSQGYEVWAAGTGLADKEILEKYQVKCVDIPFSRSPLSLKNIDALNVLKRLFHKEKFELVHVHTPVASILTRAAFRKSNYGKIIYTAHGFHFFKGAPKLNWLIYFTAEKIAAKWTDHLITINEEDYQNAQNLLPSEKISYVHGVGVEFEHEFLTENEKKHFKKQLGLSDKTIVISYIAELNNNKNHQFLLRNWERLKQENPLIELLVIGNGEKENDLKKYVEKENLLGIHFLGFRRDVLKLLQVSDVVALLSHREGLPKSIMEAMVVGIPCVVTNTRGLRDLIQSNKNGFVVNHEDDTALITAFTKLVQSTELRGAMGKCAKESIEPYLMDKVLIEYIRIYKNLLK